MPSTPEIQRNLKTEEWRLSYEQYSIVPYIRILLFVPFPSLKPQQMGFTAPLDSHHIQTMRRIRAVFDKWDNSKNQYCKSMLVKKP